MKRGVDYIGVSAGAMILNDRGEVFLAKRSGKATNERGCWETPGGGVEFGETLASAVKREIKEEYGIDIELIDQFVAADHIIPHDKQHWVATTFLARVKPGQAPKIMEPTKCEAIGWFSLNQLPSPLSLIAKHDLKLLTQRDQVEIVDIVDQENQVLFPISKQQAHKLGLLHRTVIAELIDSQGGFTLVRQAADRQDAGQFVSPVGGHVRSGESPEEALKREALEEIGINPINFAYKGKVIYNRNVLGRQENHYFILYEISSDQMPVLNHESVEFKRFTPAQITKNLRNNPNQFGEAFHFVVKTFYPEWVN